MYAFYVCTRNFMFIIWYLCKFKLKLLRLLLLNLYIYVPCTDGNSVNAANMLAVTRTKFMKMIHSGLSYFYHLLTMRASTINISKIKLYAICVYYILCCSSMNLSMWRDVNPFSKFKCCNGKTLR